MTTITADRAPMAGMKVYHLKLGMWVFLLSEVMFFTGLIGAYVILRFAHPDAFGEPGVVLNVPLTAFNTFVLVCSSTCERRGAGAGGSRLSRSTGRPMAKVRYWCASTKLVSTEQMGLREAYEAASLMLWFGNLC